MQNVTTALSMSKRGSLALNALPPRRVVEVFDHLKAMLGPKADDVYAGLDVQFVMDEWAKGLAGFRGREIERGLAACRTRTSPPNLGEFAKLCRPCLDSDAAWIEAEHCLQQRDRGLVGDWTHPAVWRAACSMSREIRAGEATAWNRKRWAAVLGRELEKGWGDEVPQPPLALPNEVKTRPPTTEEKAKIAALLQRVRKPTDERIDDDDSTHEPGRSDDEAPGTRADDVR
jgi:hypothetical protein